MLHVGEELKGSSGACSALCQFSVTPSTTHNQIRPLWCWFLGGWVCVHSRTLWSLQRTLLWSWEFLLLWPQAPQVFSISDLRLYFPNLELWVTPSVALSTCCCLTGQVQLCSPCSTVRHLAGPPATTLLQDLSAQLPLSAPPTGLDECFFFISLVVGRPYSSIFCQFWLFFVLKLLLSLFWLCEEAQCVYLRLHLGWKPIWGSFLVYQSKMSFFSGHQ